MLREIFIKNFAIIEELRIGFSEGLTIISGETGAGKSIIVSAMNLILGGRADAGMIRTGADTAELEALFDIHPDGQAAGILEEQGYEKTSQLLIRRILSAENRHRIYINGRMATMTVLSSVTGHIAGISGQHEHLRLLRESEHRRILDRFGGLEILRHALKECYGRIVPEIRALEELRSSRKSRNERIGHLEFEKNEIEEAALSPGEDEELEQELSRLKNAQTLYEGVGKSVETLYDSEGAVSDRIAMVKKEIEKTARIDPVLSGPAQALEETLFRIQDTAVQLRSYLDTIEFDPGRGEEIEARMHTIKRLKRKYGPALGDVFRHLTEIDRELSGTRDIDDRIRETEEALENLHRELVGLAGELTEKRKSAGILLARKMEEELGALNMPETTFETTFRKIETRPDTPSYLVHGNGAINENGAEQPVFMISPNPGEQPKPLSRIASGGELSRIILAMKTILVDTDPVETVVFDEVDAGIGGQTAAVVGKKLAGIAASGQVLCITHLAQIARFGDHHVKLEKSVENGRTATRVISLDKSGRVEETARMLGGQEITETSRVHAEELLRRTDESGQAGPVQCGSKTKYRSRKRAPRS